MGFFIRHKEESVEIAFRFSRHSNERKIRMGKHQVDVSSSLRFYLENLGVVDLISNELEDEDQNFIIEDSKLGLEYIMDVNKKWGRDVDSKNLDSMYYINLKMITIWDVLAAGEPCLKGKQQKILHIGNDGVYLYTLEGGVENAIYPQVCESGNALFSY